LTALAAVVVGATAAAGCRQLFGIDSTDVADDVADPDAGGNAADAPPPPVDACALAPIGTVDPCGLGDADPPVMLAGALDTDTDPRCRSYGLASGSACAIYATGIQITDTATVTVTGARPLLLVSTGDISIDGTLDLSSTVAGQVGAAANDASCMAALLPESDIGGGAGGAGGSFGSIGGDGGTGDTNQGSGDDGNAVAGVAGPTSPLPPEIRGGCPGSKGGDEEAAGGQGGAGGASGGAVWLAARAAILVGEDGLVRATGAGGGGGQVQAGGGGGGSGGMVLIEAMTIEVRGTIAANGGGGGGGGVRISGDPYSGQPGQDGKPDNSVANGGSGGPLAAGRGGNGAANTQTAKEGQSSEVGAGGGGGGGGIIRIVGPVSGGGTISPPAI
jgi:hypothetical protein